MVTANARYSASAEERDIVDCFLAFQDTRESPRKIQKPVMDFLELGRDAQSASEKAFNWREEVDEKNKPCLGLDLM